MINLVDSPHLRARQSPTKKEMLPRINISNSFMNTPLLLPSTWETRIFVDVSADAVAGHLPLPRHLEVLFDMEGFD
jgi:hypothetical protein